jgi:hypothetical protein
VWSRGVPPHLPGYISGPPVDPDCRATARAPGAPRWPAPSAHPRPPQGPSVRVGGAAAGGGPRPAPPPTGHFGCVEKCPRELASLGVSKTAPGLGLGVPAPPRPPTGQLCPNWSVLGCVPVPPRRLASPVAHAMPPPLPRPRRRPPPTRAAHLHTGNWPAPPGPRGPRRRPAGLAGRLPTAPPAAAARGPSAAHRDRRHRGRGPQHASTVGPPAWPVASRLVSLLPTRPLRLARRRNRPSSRAPWARWLLASLYTLRPHLGGEMVSKP